MALLSRADTSSVAAGPHTLRCSRSGCACGMRVPKSAIVGCIKTRRTAILAGRRIRSASALEIIQRSRRISKDFYWIQIKRPTIKLHLRFFSLRLQVSFTLEDVRFGEICLQLATNLPIGMQLAIIHNPSS